MMNLLIQDFIDYRATVRKTTENRANMPHGVAPDNLCLSYGRRFANSEGPLERFTVSKSLGKKTRGSKRKKISAIYFLCTNEDDDVTWLSHINVFFHHA